MGNVALCFIHDYYNMLPYLVNPFSNNIKFNYKQIAPAIANSRGKY